MFSQPDVAYSPGLSNSNSNSVISPRLAAVMIANTHPVLVCFCVLPRPPRTGFQPATSTLDRLIGYTTKHSIGPLQASVTPLRRSILDSLSFDAIPATDRRHPTLVALCSLLSDSGELPYLRQLMLMRASVGSVMSSLFLRIGRLWS
jgi:hypothetical protein